MPQLSETVGGVHTTTAEQLSDFFVSTGSRTHHVGMVCRFSVDVCDRFVVQHALYGFPNFSIDVSFSCHGRHDLLHTRVLLGNFSDDRLWSQ